MLATRISPGSTRSMSSGPRTTRTGAEGDAGAGRGAGDDQRRRFFGAVVFLFGGGGDCAGGDGAGLDDVELAALVRPFDVLGAAVVVLDLLADGGEVAAPADRSSFGWRCWSSGTSTQRLFSWVASRRSLRTSWRRWALISEWTIVEVFLVYDEVVGGDGAGDDRLAEPVDGVDRDLGGVVAARVDHEHDAGALRLHHVLDDDGDTDFELAVATLGAVEDRAGFEEGGPALLDGAEDFRLALDVQVRALLAGEGGLGDVFGGGGAADGHRQALHLAVGAGDRGRRCRRASGRR